MGLAKEQGVKKFEKYFNDGEKLNELSYIRADKTEEKLYGEEE
ncbi:MAG: hypothetical protein ACTSV5_08525 [Promethearchaeota archaeon]